MDPPRTTELFHEVAGDGPDVVLLHAALGDARMWDRQWDAFSHRFRTTRCDLRGWGRSQIRPGRFSNAADVLALLAGLRVERAALVGVSMGATVALELALPRRELARTLVLVNPPPLDGEWSGSVQAFQEREAEALARGDVDEVVAANVDMWLVGPERSREEVEPALVDLVDTMLRDAIGNWLPVIETAEEEPLVPDLTGRLR